MVETKATYPQRAVLSLSSAALTTFMLRVGLSSKVPNGHLAHVKRRKCCISANQSNISK